MGISLPCPGGNLRAAVSLYPASAAAEHFGSFPSTTEYDCDRTFALSEWSASSGKRVFDIACVLCALPVVLPIFVAVGLAVRLTSRGPIVFRQRRMGRNGGCFTILKFRTMPVNSRKSTRPSLTSLNNQQFTLIGRFLRRWKLDEIPQLINILRGEMSLVGPRPKLACYESGRLACRPGLTGFATLVFAREEVALATLPPGEVDAYYQAVLKPMKLRLDANYMAQATFFSDIKIILKSVFRDWDDLVLSELPTREAEMDVSHVDRGFALRVN
jgi:lipopolysaccharide/colanic/teichoic acid biosynthesis glycosyltransferase